MGMITIQIGWNRLGEKAQGNFYLCKNCLFKKPTFKMLASSLIYSYLIYLCQSWTPDNNIGDTRIHIYLCMIRCMHINISHYLQQQGHMSVTASYTSIMFIDEPNNSSTIHSWSARKKICLYHFDLSITLFFLTEIICQNPTHNSLELSF